MVEYALQMLQNSDQEMQYRNVVNRAYYGAFLTARDAAGITNNSGSIHRDVIQHYQDKKKSIIGNNLDVLKKLRQTADYEPQHNMSIHDAKKSCRTAEKILTELES